MKTLVEYDISIHTFRILCNIALKYNIKIVRTKQGVIDTQNRTFTYMQDVRGATYADSQWSKDEVNVRSQAIYQQLPTDIIARELHLSVVYSGYSFIMLSTFTNAFVCLQYSNRSFMPLFPDYLTVYDSTQELLKGNIYGHTEFNSECDDIGYKGILIMISGIDNDEFDEVDSYTYDEYLNDIYYIASSFNPEI